MPIQLQKVERPQLGEKGYAPAISDPNVGMDGRKWLFDRDFRGTSIQNPKPPNTLTPILRVKKESPTSMNYVGRAQVPFYKSAQDMYDGIAGNLDYYGRKRTWF